LHYHEYHVIKRTPYILALQFKRKSSINILLTSKILPSDPPLPIRHCLKLDRAAPLPHHLHATCIDPLAQILALTDIKQLQISAAFDDRLDARASDSHAAAYAKIAEFEKVQRNTAQGRVGDGGPAEGEV
jgi:hypothetical protein